MNNKTSERHTEILDSYQSGASKYAQWAKANLGEIRITDWTFGELNLEWELDGRFVMPDGVMFGGHISSVADHVASLGTMTVLSDSRDRFRTSRLETNFFRPMSAAVVTINVRVTNVSARLIHVEADFLDPSEKLLVRIHAMEVRRRIET